MKTVKWMSVALAGPALFLMSSCTDWGQADPPAAGQIKPTLEQVAAYDFEAEEGLDPNLFTLTANPGGVLPEIVDDEVKGKVLRINNGHLAVANPLNPVTVQKAVSMTFWMKQPVAMTVDDDGEETPLPQDVESDLISFENASRNGIFSFNANGGFEYKAPDGEWKENSPADYLTGYITPGDWHYVALCVRDDGYDLYVDGQRKVYKQIDGFDCSKIVSFLNNVPTLYIGDTAQGSEWLLDDLKIYRNEITAREIARPALGGGGSGGSEIDLSTWRLLGNEDNTTPFWSQWSDYVNLTGNGTVHYEFYNYHGGQTDNWCNWGLVLTTGAERGADGYAEYLYLRADAYGWGSNYEGGVMTHDFDWGTFMQEMDGAFVTLDITRAGTDVTVTALIKAENGTERHYSFKMENIDGEVLGTFLTCERSHLLINPEALFVGKTFAAQSNVTGATDCSTGWWSAWSELNRFDGPFQKWGVEFVNHTTGTGANWNNWLLISTNGTWIGGDGYAENFVLRSDAYGWGAAFDAGNTAMESAFDWDNYVADMKDCNVKVLFSYNGSTLDMYCTQTTADGRRMPDYLFRANSLDAPLGLFFTCELAWLEFTKIGYYPWAEMKTVQ